MIKDNIAITIAKKIINIIFFGPSSFDLNNSEIMPIRPMKITWNEKSCVTQRSKSNRARSIPRKIVAMENMKVKYPFDEWITLKNTRFTFVLFNHWISIFLCLCLRPYTYLKGSRDPSNFIFEIWIRTTSSNAWGWTTHKRFGNNFQRINYPWKLIGSKICPNGIQNSKYNCYDAQNCMSSSWFRPSTSVYYDSNQWDNCNRNCCHH